jgi:F-type H+-transporting ATPase subunit b
VSWLSLRGLAGAPVARALSAAAEGAEHAATFLGVPLWIWQLANLGLFLGLLYHFVAKPLTAYFRRKQLEVEERLREAETRRREAARLETEIQQRMARLDAEILEIRARGTAEGEAERAALIERASAESDRVRKEAAEEIARRLESAKEELRHAAADLTASSAREIVSRQITEDDRKRLLEESVRRMEETR